MLEAVNSTKYEVYKRRGFPVLQDLFRDAFRRKKYCFVVYDNAER
jgi:hypothetical protein